MTDAQQNNQPVFSIEKLYVKDLSLEIPNAPQAFLEREQPTVDIQLHHNSSMVEEGLYQTVLTVTVTAKIQDRTLFLVQKTVDVIKIHAGELAGHKVLVPRKVARRQGISGHKRAVPAVACLAPAAGNRKPLFAWRLGT